MSSRVFITGATGGFGRILAVECARRGWDLLLTDMDEEKLKNFCGALSYAYDIAADYIPCDMSDFSCRTALIERIASLGISLHILINVAGIDPEGPFLSTSRETILRVANINLVAALDMIRSLTAFRCKDRTFHILNVFSMGGLFPMPIKAVYAASKRALIDMTYALSAELKPLGITVTGVCPAGMATNEAMLKSMSVQGFMRNLTTLELGVIASSTIDKTLKGKVLYIPGFFNRFIVCLTRFLPVRFVCRFIYKRWQRTYREFSAALAASDMDRAQTGT